MNTRRDFWHRDIRFTFNHHLADENDDERYRERLLAARRLYLMSHRAARPSWWTSLFLPWR